MPAGKTAQLISSVQWGNSMAIRIGTNAANLINGTSGNDFIFGFAGDDLINGGAGNDWIFAGAGNDQLFGGDGNDWLFAGTGNDVGSGGDGNDFVFGEAGNDVLNGGRGSDTVDGGTGSDTLIFTDSERGGLDRYIGGAGQDSLVLEFTAARWADPAVKAQVLAYLNFIGAGNQGNFNLSTMNLIVSSVEALVVKVDGVIIDPRATGNTAPTGQADSYFTGENGILNVSPVTERGTLVDNDNTGTGAFTVELVTGPARGAVALNDDGTFTFNPGAAFDYLAAGQNTTETFTYRIVNSAGTSAPITVTLNIAGANDAAVIGGSRTGSVTEDNTVTTASGTVTVTDADAGQSAVANPGTLQGAYGSLALAANGAWVYTLNNSLAATQALAAGASTTETFAVTSADGTAASSIVVTVNGTNDTAVIGGTRTGSVSEDNTVTTASGTVTVTDADTGQSAVANPGTLQGTYGSLALAANGAWVYTINNALAATQALGAGVSATETFAISSSDGSANSAINITVNGANDIATLSGDFAGTVREDFFTLEFEAILRTTSGQIVVTDADSGQSLVGNPGSYTGTYGSLVLQAGGNWVYTIDNSLPSVQSLGEGVSVTETFAVNSLDGSATTPIVITVLGTNDEADVSGDLTSSVTEDDVFSNDGTDFPPQTSGQITIADVDAGEGSIADPGTYNGLYGSLDLAADGSWTYTLDNALQEVQSLGAEETTNDVFTLFTDDGTLFEVSINVQGVNDAAVVEGDFSDTIILAFEDSSASGSVTVTDIDRGENGVFADIYQGDYGSLTMNADGAWEYLLTTFDVPFDENVFDVFDTITAYTLGGDAFDITIDIRQNDFIIG
jgi:VCBS repeat-containing protein